MITNEQRKVLGDPLKYLNTKVKTKFDLRTLESILAFICNDNKLRTRRHLSNIMKLFDDILDLSVYEEDESRGPSKEYVWIIQTFLYAKLMNGLTDDLALDYVKAHKDAKEYTVHLVDELIKKWSKKDVVISTEDCWFLIDKVYDIIRYGHIVPLRDTLRDLLDNLDESDMKSFKSIELDMHEVAVSLIAIERKYNGLEDMTFSLDEEVFTNAIDRAVSKLKDKNRMFRTGIKALNAILSPAFMSKRLYTFLALPGMGKSTILLKSAIDIKKYNNPEPKDPDKVPCVVFLTLENSVEETIERMYNMVVDDDDIRNYSTEEIIDKFRNSGLSLSDDSGVNIIIKEFKNREIDCNDIHILLKDLEDEGSEPICLIVDYMKRLKPSEKAPTEKEELKNISNELKEIAKTWDIPVITAQQLNRSGAAAIDSALNSDKSDVTRLLGRENIGSSWEIEDSRVSPCRNICKKYLSNCWNTLIA